MAGTGRPDGCSCFCLECGGHAFAAGQKAKYFAGCADQLESGFDASPAHGAVGILIMGLSMMGILSLFIGLIVIVPMLGHASWHAYRDLVDTRDVPERMPREEAV